MHYAYTVVKSNLNKRVTIMIDYDVVKFSINLILTALPIGIIFSGVVNDVTLIGGGIGTPPPPNVEM